MHISKLEWDSNFFDLHVGKISSKNSKEEVKQILKIIELSDFDLVYLFSKFPLPNYIKNLFFNETKLTFKKKISSCNNINIAFPFDGELNQDVINLALDAGDFSRFKLDKRLSRHFNDLYTKWIENSISKKFADQVFTVEKSNKIAGFITLKKVDKKSAYIGLIAVNREFRKSGVAKKLILAAENWVSQQNLHYLYVSTQKQNINACQFYYKMGFILEHKEYIFHIWNSKFNV